jgi:hypothetical protein
MQRMLGRRRAPRGHVRQTQHVKTRCLRGALATIVAIGTVALAWGDLQAVGAATPRYQFGINTFVTYRCQAPATYLAWATSQIDAYTALGANSIALAFPLYTSSLASNDVVGALDCKSGRYQTPPVWLLSDVVGIAHDHGLQVLFRPLIDVQAPYPESKYAWSGILEPTDLQVWIRNYDAALSPFVVMAQRMHVEHFAIDSELDSIANRKGFWTVIVNARKLYSGNLVANYTWSSFWGKTPWSGTTPGVDTYPKVHDISPSQSPASILGQWDWLLSHRPAYSMPEISQETIDEIGIAAQDGAPAKPSSGSLPPATHPFNQAVQARWFTAACSFMKQHEMQGIYYWGQWMAALNGHLLTSPSPTHPSFLQPASQRAIRACFT